MGDFIMAVLFSVLYLYGFSFIITAIVNFIWDIIKDK